MGAKARLMVLLAIAAFAALACQVALGYWSGAGSDGAGNGATTRA